MNEDLAGFNQELSTLSAFEGLKLRGGGRASSRSRAPSGRKTAVTKGSQQGIKKVSEFNFLAHKRSPTFPTKALDLLSAAKGCNLLIFDPTACCSHAGFDR